MNFSHFTRVSFLSPWAVLQPNKRRLKITTRLATCLLLTCSVLSGYETLARAKEPSAAPRLDEKACIELLRSGAPSAEKALACKRLAICGSSSAVESLAGLLGDPQLASWSRIALEAIPDPTAGKALVQASQKLHGPLLVGVINSIGVRQEASAVESLVPRLQDSDVETAAAAAVALGRIATPPAIAALRKALHAAPVATRGPVAEGCLLAAERLLANGPSADAASLYDLVRQSQAPRPRLLEAMRGAVLARDQKTGLPLLIEMLRAADEDAFQIGLATARELGGSDVTAALVQELVRSDSPRTEALLSALADRGDRSGEATRAVMTLLDAADLSVRTAAAKAIARLGDASSAVPLLRVAGHEDESLAAAASAALEALSGQEVDQAVANALAHADRAIQLKAIEIVGLRRIQALDALRKALSSDDPLVRAAALGAMGATVGPAELGSLVQQVLSPAHPEDVDSAVEALRAAAVRMPDLDACAAAMIDALPKASAPTRTRLLEILGEVGGKRAAEALRDAAITDGQFEDVASRMLGQWMNADAAPALLQLAQRASESKYKVRALRGYLRIARQFRLPEAERAAMCTAALEAAERIDERRLALEVLERYPSLETLQATLKALAHPELKEQASAIALGMVDKLPEQSTQVKALLTSAGLPSP